MDMDVEDRATAQIGEHDLPNEELSDAQIEQLLQQAEHRIRQQQKSLITKPSGHVSHLPLAAKLDTSALPQPYVRIVGDVAYADARRLIDEKQRRLADGKIRKMEDPVAAKRKALEDKRATAGAEWFNLPRTNLTSELKRDLHLLRMRSVLDPKRFYKKENSQAKAPEFSQTGTLLEGPTDYYSARMSNKERKRTLIEEILAGEQTSGRFEKKYRDIQAAKTSGKKGQYKALMAKKYGKNVKH